MTFITQVADGEVFAGAWLGTLEVEAPAAGEWRLVTSGPEGAAYLMVAALEGGVTAVLDLGGQLSVPGAARTVSVSLQGADVAESRASLTLAAATGRLPDSLGLSGGRGAHRAALPVPRAARRLHGDGHRNREAQRRVALRADGREQLRGVPPGRAEPGKRAARAALRPRPHQVFTAAGTSSRWLTMASGMQSASSQGG